MAQGTARDPGDTLYADELVRAVLADHKIAEVPAGGPIWQRFPQPVLLTERLVADLYWHCGVGLIHIEVVTGQPEHTVRGFMRRAGIATRHPGGRSPFLRRWRTGVPIGPGPPWDGRSRHAMTVQRMLPAGDVPTCRLCR